MKNFNEFPKRFNRARQAFLLAAVMLSMVACATNPTTSSTSSETPQLLFVHIAEDFKADTAAKTIRLVDINQQTLYFSDRPFRIAGHLKMDDYLKEWTAKAGKDNFGANPPNAALSVYEAGKHDNTLVIVEISDPQIDGSDLIYSYKLIEGSLPVRGGPTSLFIDRIGVGGGVGPGRRGVGVGRRGPGL